MAPPDRTSPTEPLQDPSLARYSERQLAVANTWATHFSLAGTARAKFIRHYLRSTSTTRCWCITVAADNGVRYTIMRAGPLLQVFDGQLIGAWECNPAHRIPASTPSPAGALKLLQRLQTFDDAVAVLWPHTTTNDNGESIRHFLPCPFSLLDSERPQATTMPCDWYLDMGRILGQVADEGISVINFFAWLFQAPRASIRFLSHVSPGRAGGALFHRKREGRHSGWHALLLAASLGNRRPITRAQWTAFYAAYNAIPWQIHNAKPDYNRLFNGCPSDWQDPAWLAITARLRDIKEFYTALDQGNSQVVRQARSALKAYLGHCTYRQAGNLVDDYHQVQRELRATVQSSLADLVDTDEYTTWEGMLPVGLIACPNGLQIAELRCPADLYAEHIALAHCIDSYDQAAYRGDCRLLSVREAGRPLASAELELRREHGEPLGRPWNPQHLSTVQLREFDNAPVPADSPAGQAYRWFMERIRSGAIATNLNWPDMTVHMTRFADGRWKAGLAEATAKWLLTRLENR
ncbi:hypothetical protein YH69_26870 [Pseudomonas aeruginosa]|uniref:hypothetical protein n=1 Tax=Pseudomonas aeruginosa TaxID=287 RepID=UPI000624EBB5|nr:hypothetical protein YH69_26870 [Pseudomonas aeruginosa]RUD26114.1 hypothetical protein IPC1375_11090 [Pseudomonas aeruginosa]